MRCPLGCPCTRGCCGGGRRSSGVHTVLRLVPLLVGLGVLVVLCVGGDTGDVRLAAQRAPAGVGEGRAGCLVPS